MAESAADGREPLVVMNQGGSLHEMPASGLDEALAALRSAYQPIVDLRSRLIVAHEALARAPAGSGLERPERLFGAAAQVGRTAEVDWACRTAAVRGAIEAGVGRDDTLFVNVEPASLGEPCPVHLRDAHDAAASNLRVVLEITERDLTTDPATLLAVVASARRAGWGVALDDIGAEPASLALMPYLHPDFIKLDQRLVHNPGDSRTAAVVNAVRAQAERTGATILAEGIETEAQRDRALSMGATLGQGWLFGHPGRPRPTTGEATRFVVEPPPADTRTPFEIIAAARPVEQTTKALLVDTSCYIEERLDWEREPPVLLANFQEAAFFSAEIARRYTNMASNAAFVGAVARGLDANPAPGVRGAALDDSDKANWEWNVIVTTPHFAAALVARDLGDAGADSLRRFDSVVTYDRELVLAAARSLFARIAPIG